MMTRNKLHFAAIALTCLTLAVPMELPAQSGGYSNSAQLSKRYWDLWRTGFESYEAGESALLAGRNEEAADCYRRALNAFQAVRKNNPNWNRNVINYRISLADRRFKTALRRLKFQNASAAKEYGAIDTSGEATRKLQEQIKALQDSLAESERINLNLRKLAEQGKVARDQVVDLLKEKKEIEKKYESLVLQYNESKRTAATASAGSSTLEKAFKREQARSEALLKIVEELRKESRDLQTKFQRAQDQLDAGNRKLNATSRELATAKKAEDLLKDLRARYARMEKDLNDKLDTIKNELKIAQSRLAAKTKECDTLRKDQGAAARKLAEEAERLRNQSFALKKDIDFLKENIKNKDKLINEASNREMRLNSMVASLNEKNKNTDAKLKSNERALIAEQNKVRQSEQKFAVLNAENKDLKAKVKLLAEQVNKIPVVTAAAEGEKLKAQQDIKRLNGEIAARSKELASVKQELDAARKKLAAANKALAAANQKLNASNQALATANQKLNASNQALATANQKLNASNQALATANQKYEKTSKDLAAANKSLETARKAGETQKQKIQQLEKALADLKKNYNAKDEATKLRISQLEKSITDFKIAAAGKDEASKLNVKLQELLDLTRKQLAEQKIAAAGKADAVKQSNKLQKQLDQIKKELEAQKIAAAGKADAEKRIAQLQKQLDQVKTDLTAQKTAAAGKADVVKRNTQLQNQIAQLKKNLEAQKAVSAKTAALQAEINRLTVELKKVTTAQKQADAKLASAQKGSGDLQKTIRTIKEDRDVLAERNKKLSKDLLNTQALLEKARLQAQDDTKLRAAEKARDGWKARTENANKKNVELSKKIQEGKDSLNKMRTAMADLEKKRDVLLKKLQRTESELEGWKKNQNMISKNELTKQVKVTDAMAKELKAKNDEINKLKAQLKRNEAMLGRNRSTIHAQMEKIIAENRRLQDALAQYRRNDPNAGTAIPKTQALPKDVEKLISTPNDERDRASRADVKKYEKLMTEGAKLAKAKKYDDALWQYWAAADAGVNRPEPYIEIARIHALRNNPEQGIRAYERALRLGAKRDQTRWLWNTLKKQLVDKKKKAQ